ncbi:MAG: ATP-binding cassette domain-containing protein [Propionibacteriaceae bacterium]|nr:ATP-binding cassette domain-containing protein [Propionibacteriaceae bacterium]
MIRFQNVCFAYGDAAVLTDLSFDCPSGAVAWLWGANGAGKTTVTNLALGLLTPDAGQIEAPTLASAVFQEDRLCEHLTAVANVRLGLGHRVAAAEILDELALAGLTSQDAGRPVSRLSGGQRRRVALVRALMRDCDLLCLDEPYTGIDEASVDEVVAYTLDRIEHRSVLLVCHDQQIAARFAPTTVRL